MSVVVRFAPSPTGNLHIGGARTAIFNYLYARSTGGKFYLRIEDTDIERSKKEYEEEIIHSMKWLGMEYDGELTYQTQRMDIYKTYIKKLLDSGYAYYCNCTKEELEAEREKAIAEKKSSTDYNRKCREQNLNQGVVRFKTPLDGATVIHDLVLGDITIQNKEIEDFVIARSDGTPTYNFTVVVDDAEMAITHVIRGDDHVNNTPKQLMIFKALGLTPPNYAHVPMILGADKKKLSKRHGSTAVSQYRQAGYLPEALFNYLVRLSWSHGDDEIFTIDKLKTIFSLDTISNSSAVLNLEKLDWLNGHYIRECSSDRITKILIEDGFVPSEYIDFIKSEEAQKMMPIVKERAKHLTEIFDSIKFIFGDYPEISLEMKTKCLLPELKPAILELAEKLEACSNIADHAQVEILFKEVLEKHNIKMKIFAPAIRTLLTGLEKSPGIFELLGAMDKNKIIKRLKNI